MSLKEDRACLAKWVLLGDPQAAKMPLPLVPLYERILQALQEYGQDVLNQEKKL